MLKKGTEGMYGPTTFSGGHVPFLKRVDGKTTLCGKSAKRIRGSSVNKNMVSCPRCLKGMKQQYWYCKTHGFIEDTEVTNSSHCKWCGDYAIAEEIKP